jgi:diguanylate cyclase (GGDEF)-like protein
VVNAEANRFPKTCLHRDAVPTTMITPISPAQHSTLLYVEPNPERARELQRRLEPHGIDVILASSYMAAVTALTRQPVALLLACLRLPEGNGIELLRIARRHYPDIASSLLLDPEELGAAADALRAESFNYLIRDPAGAFQDLLPQAAEKLMLAQRDANERRRLEQALAQQEAVAAAAAQNCEHGLAIFDAELRLQLCNHGFLEFFAYPPELGARGTPLGEMLRFNLERGDYGSNADRDEAERRLRRLHNGKEFRFERAGRNGKLHEISGRRLADGGLAVRFRSLGDQTQTSADEHSRTQHDALTGLANAALFRELLKHQVQRGSRSGYNGAALLLLHVDGFDELRRSHGGDAGDAVLKEVGRRLARAVRECDVVARLDVERFGILLIDVNTQENAEIVAGKMLRSVSPTYRYGDLELRLSASIGLAFEPTELHNDEQLMQMAEDGIAKARAAGANRYKIA